VATALRELHEREGRDIGAVFATRDGNEPDAANVRREFKAAVKAADIPGTWTPPELRHTFVSLISDSGVPVEEIARLAGHANSRTTRTRVQAPAQAGHGERCCGDGRVVHGSCLARWPVSE
jgi:integrase